jgi:hypothetical protein
MPEKRMSEKRMTKKRMTEKRMTVSQPLLTHKEFHAIMNRSQFTCDLSGQDADDYDAFIDAKIREYIKAHNDKTLHDKS